MSNVSEQSNSPSNSGKLSVRDLLQQSKTAQLELGRVTVVAELVRLCYQETNTLLAQRAARALETLPDITLLFYVLDGRNEYTALLNDLLNRKEFMSRYRTNGHNAIRKDLDLLRFELPVFGKREETLYEAGLLVLLALHANRFDLLLEANSGIGIIEPMVELYQDGVFKERIVEFLLALPAYPYKDRLCWFVLENPASPVCEMVLNHKLAPVENRERALFYFLTEQWDKYGELDFNSALLRELYTYGLISPDLKRQVLQAARKSGRTEFVQFLVGDEKLLTTLSLEEWQLLAQTNVSEKNWPKLWQLAQTAPPVIALRILRTLVKVHWRPPSQADQGVFEKLVAKAEDCVATGGLPFGWRLELKTAKRFALNNHEPYHKVLLGHDARTLVISFMYRIEVWDIKENVMLANIPSGVTFLKSAHDPVNVLSDSEIPYRINQLALSPDCKKLAVSDCWSANWWDYEKSAEVTKYRIRVYNIAKNSEMPFISYIATDIAIGGIDLVFSSNNLQLAACFNQQVHLWHLAERESPHRSFVVGPSQAAIQYTSDCRFLVGATDSLNPSLWQLDITTGVLITLAEGCLRDITRLVFTPDGNYLLATNTRNALQLWSYPAMRNLATKVVYDLPVDAIIFLAGQNRLITRHANIVRIWEIPSLTLLSHQLYPEGTKDVQISFDREEQALLVFLFAHYFNFTHPGVIPHPDFNLEFFNQETSFADHSSQENCYYWNSAVTQIASAAVPENPISHLEKINEFLNLSDLPQPEKTWLDFIQTLLSYRARFAIEVDLNSTIYADAHDIELDFEN